MRNCSFKSAEKYLQRSKQYDNLYLFYKHKYIYIKQNCEVNYRIIKQKENRRKEPCKPYIEGKKILIPSRYIRNYNLASDKLKLILEMSFSHGSCNLSIYINTFGGRTYITETVRTTRLKKYIMKKKIGKLK